MKNTIQPKVIKRYVNRKFYDTETHRYLTLSQIHDFAKTGREMIVVDRFKKDITSKTLLASIIEVQSKQEQISISEIVAFIKTHCK